MEFLSELLPIVLYFLGAILLLVIIILLTKLVGTVDRLNVLLDDIERKSQSLNGLFDAIENVGSTISKANNGIANFVTKLVSKLLKAKRKMKRKKQVEEMEDYE